MVPLRVALESMVLQSHQLALLKVVTLQFLCFVTLLSPRQGQGRAAGGMSE